MMVVVVDVVGPPDDDDDNIADATDGSFIFFLSLLVN